MGSIPEALVSYDNCLKLDVNNRNAGQNKLLALNYIHGGEEQMVCDAHMQWGREFQQLFTPLPQLPPSDQDAADSTEPLIVAYISPDLFTHSVSYFAEAPLRHHHSSAVKHIVYNCSPRGDSKTEMLRCATEGAGGVWKDVAKLSEQDLAALVTAQTMLRHLCSACRCLLLQVNGFHLRLILKILHGHCITMSCLISCPYNSMTEPHSLHSVASLCNISCVHA